MPKTILFLAHGMGHHEAEWADSTIKLIRELPAKYGYSWFAQNGGFDANVRVVPIRYDGVFSRYLDEWGRTSEALRAKAGEFGVDISQIIGWLEAADETEKNFFWTHVVDVLLYRFFSIVTAEVRLRVRAAIADELNKARKDGTLVASSVLAHSLGTSVMHDSLALLGSQPIPTPEGPNSSWMVGNHKFDSVFMCANVGRVLETEPGVYTSPMRPPVAGKESYVDAYYNFRHELDPFTVVRRFKPVDFGDRYLEPVLSEKALQFNVHDIAHYLSDPRAHVIFYRGLLGRFVVSDAEYLAARQSYDALNEPECIAEVQKFKAAVKKIIDLAQTGGDPMALIIAGTQFLAAAKEAKDACI